MDNQNAKILFKSQIILLINVTFNNNIFIYILRTNYQNHIFHEFVHYTKTPIFHYTKKTLAYDRFFIFI